METDQKRSRKLVRKISISSSFKEMEREEKTYWISQKPLKRLQHIETLRKINYGKEASRRLQRVFEVTKRA